MSGMMCSGNCPWLITWAVWLAEVPDNQEHEDAGEQHASDHDELVLGGSPLNQPHHCVGQPQHVGHIQHLLVRPLQRRRDRVALVHPEAKTCMQADWESSGSDGRCRKYCLGGLWQKTPLLTHRFPMSLSLARPLELCERVGWHPDKSPGRPPPWKQAGSQFRAIRFERVLRGTHPSKKAPTPAFPGTKWEGLTFTVFCGRFTAFAWRHSVTTGQPHEFCSYISIFLIF